jgi:hypothetical protein
LGFFDVGCRFGVVVDGVDGQSDDLQVPAVEFGFYLRQVPQLSGAHTGVKFRGCGNSTAHESPIQSWKLSSPSVVPAWKSGAVSPIRRFMCLSSFVG